ncbi:neural cell adhesion molecule 1-like [Pectinophora gossypiella]|uniref:neural cell adhesion molecule 1-like n=1 Tax=Pectinophora gossypiella TaxID=13191 RepID=UPI00214E007E|nr:neural cell adhesion molecule 1-like [Pectinophora gossypiella]
MRWVTLAVVFFSLVCSAFSADSNEEPSLRIKARSSMYNVGEQKGIYCVGTNVKDRVEWISPSGEIVGGRSKNNRLYVERRASEPHLATLIIHSTRLTDSGNWTCKAGELSETIEIVVGEKVVMATDFEEVQADEGKSVRLTCEAKGNPQPTVAWYKEGVPITEDSKYIIKKKENTYTLEVRRLTHADAAEYMCKVTQKALSHYTQKIIKLAVHHKPIPFNPETKEIYVIDEGAKYRTEEVFAVLNETKNITCSALANPPPKFEWSRKKGSFDQKIREEDSISTSEDLMSSTLTLRMRDETDQGQYKCTARNEKGTITTIFDVRPGKKPAAPDGITLINANATYLTFNVSCSENCTFADENTKDVDPENLSITGFSFLLVPHREEYPADWDSGEEFIVRIEDPEVSLFDVGPLPNTTVFHVRVRSINAAGYSDWFDMPELPSTTASAIRLVATILLLAVTFIATMCY